jgi:hypothetical protein
MRSLTADRPRCSNNLNVDDAKERIKQVRTTTLLAERKRLESNKSTNLKGLVESVKKYLDDEVTFVKGLCRTAAVVCAYKADEHKSENPP